METSEQFFPATSWQGSTVGRLAHRIVKPVASRIPFTPQVMKLSQLGFDAVTLALPVHADVHIAPADAGGVPGEWLIAGRDVVTSRVVLYFHGGAYFFGSPRSHRALTWRLSQACNAKVLAIDYRQPPDWHYPAPLEDAVIAYKDLLAKGYKPENIIIAGDSAGGNLSLVTMIKLRELGLPLPAASVLISPWADLSCTGDSLVSNDSVDQLIPVNALRFVAGRYSKGQDPASPLISPIYADYTGLPPLLIQVGNREVLLSDAERVFEQAKKAGVPCRYQVWDDMVHVFQVLAGFVPESALAVKEIGAFVEQAIEEAGGDKGMAYLRRARLVTGRLHG